MGFADHEPGIRILTCRCFLLSGWKFDDLSAPHWRLYWNDRPGARVILGGKATRMTPGRFVLIPPDTHFAARQSKPVKHFYLHFLADSPFDRAEPGIYSFGVSEQFVSEVKEVESELKREPQGSPRTSLLCRSLVSFALSRLPKKKLSAAPLDERILLAVRAVERSPARPLANAEMAEQAGMSANAFVRLFRTATGSTPQNWQTSRRIAQSCILLAGSSRSIEEVAAEVGFCDRYHFSRVFKKLRGTGPAEYRRRSQLERAGL